jgi:hypothetical protein
MTHYVYKPKRSTMKLYDFMCSSLRFLHIISHNFLQTFSICHILNLSGTIIRGTPKTPKSQLVTLHQHKAAKA